MRQPRLSLRQALPFRGAWRKRLELGAAPGQQVALGLDRRGVLHAAIRALESVLPRPPGERDFARHRRKTAVGIEQPPLSFRAAERLMRVLPVQIDQKLADGLELSQRRRAAIDLRAASALRIEHAAQQERSFLREIVFDEPCPRGRRILELELGGYFRALGGMIDCAVTIDEHFVYAMRADGLIVATPTGSTAYALSAQGPIVDPGVPAILLVPVAPHALSNRPIAVRDSAVVTITLLRGKDASLHSDGQAHYALAEGDRVVVARAAHRVRLLHPKDHDHFAMLRRKLHWAETPDQLRPARAGAEP